MGLNRLNQIFREIIEQIKATVNAPRRYGRGLSAAIIDNIRWLQVTITIRDLVTAFMNTNHVPGASLAIAYKGRLVFRKGYGFANALTNDPVTTDHLFRIASLSKPITSVAVFRLIDAGKLKLSDRVFGSGGILGSTFSTPNNNQAVNQITVQHLLEHTSGWANSQDPMLDHFEMNQSQLITWMLDQPLSTTPGSTHSYLNFGYLVLGRVIERRSGMSYADFVDQQVLAPCGISEMHIAGDTLADRRTNEVVYYGFPQGSLDPYAIQVSRMDAHGGWIASPTDLLRFLVRVDGFATVPDILSSSSLGTMFTPTTAHQPNGQPSDYAKGWNIHAVGNHFNHFHRGRLPGTSAFLVQTYNEFCWAVLMNSLNFPDEDTAGKMIDDLDALMRNINEQIKVWPQGNPL